MTNSDNGESIYKALLEYAIADKYTPWEWANFLPYEKCYNLTLYQNTQF